MSENSVVIVGAKRTAVGSLLGQFTGVATPQLGATAIRAALAQAGVAAGRSRTGAGTPGRLGRRHFDRRGLHDPQQGLRLGHEGDHAGP